MDNRSRNILSVHIKSISKAICNSINKNFSLLYLIIIYLVQIKLRNTKCSVKTLAGYIPKGLHLLIILQISHRN